MLRKIYHLLYSRYGSQGWWPVTPTGCKDREVRPIYGILTRTDRQRLEICVGAILTQNTSWKNVEKAIENLNKKDLIDIKRLSKIKKEELAMLIKPAGYFNQKAERLILFSLHLFNNYKGDIKKFFRKQVMELRGELLLLKGIGPETADSIILYAAEKPVFVIDAYTKRIFSRIGICKSDVSYDELQQLFHSNLPRDAALFNEFHALIVEHAKRHCKRTPLCKGCKIRKLCDKWKSLKN